MEKLIKILQYKVADIDVKQRLVKAYFSAFNNEDNEGDVLTPGAFTKTMNENGPKGRDIIRHFLNHEFKSNPGVLPIGKIKELGEDSHGGFFVSKMARTNSGNDIYSLYEDGFINSHSMGFQIIKQKVEKAIRYITEIKLFEVSTVTTWAANDNTPTIEVKEAPEPGQPTPNKYDSLFIEPSMHTHKEIADIKELYRLLNF